MSSANLSNAFNTFYAQNAGFPKPDVSRDENTMMGFDPGQAGMTAGDIVFCQVSPLHVITLDAETKAAARIPSSATSFAWAYPMVREPGQSLPRGANESAFVQYGGYMYFNDRQDVVGTNAITPAPLGTLGLMFGRAQVLPFDVGQSLLKQGRFQEITLDVLRQAGATHFGWIRPGEFRGKVASADGCFAYMFADSRLRYFPIVSKPVFTKELLEEQLEEGEAWVVVRRSNAPAIEQAVIFDRSKSIDDNIDANSHTIDSGHFTSVQVTCESLPSVSYTYEEWRSAKESGTIADPWIFQLSGSSTTVNM